MRGGAPLHQAAARGDTEALQQLLTADPSAAADAAQHGITPLHRAAAGGHEGAARLLLQAHPPAAMVLDGRGLLPLHCAIRGRHAPVVSLLLDAAPDSASFLHDFPNPCCGNTTALHAAAQRPSASVVRLLLEAAPHTAAAANAHSHTPLHVAVFGGCYGWNGSGHDPHAPWPVFVEMSRLMLGAAPSAALVRDWGGDTPLSNCGLAGAPPELVRLVAAAAPEAAEVRMGRGGGMRIGGSWALVHACQRWKGCDDWTRGEHGWKGREGRERQGRCSSTSTGAEALRRLLLLLVPSAVTHSPLLPRSPPLPGCRSATTAAWCRWAAR